MPKTIHDGYNETTARALVVVFCNIFIYISQRMAHRRAPTQLNNNVWLIPWSSPTYIIVHRILPLSACPLQWLSFCCLPVVVEGYRRRASQKPTMWINIYVYGQIKSMRVKSLMINYTHPWLVYLEPYNVSSSMQCSIFLSFFLSPVVALPSAIFRKR